MSPLARKTVAIGLVVLTMLLSITLILAPLWSATEVALDDLAQARARRARLEAIRDRPLPRSADPVPPILIVTAKDARLGQRLFEQIVREKAAGNAVTISNLTIVPMPGNLLRLAAQATGKELDVVRFVNAIEAGNPVIRARSWRLSVTEPGMLALQAELEAVWMPSR